jgi:hypothetical protein
MSLRTKGGLAAQASRVALHRCVESIGPRRDAAPGTVPISIDRVTPQWLTVALCSGAPSASVTGFELESGTNGTSARRAMTLHYNSAGDDAGLPRHVFTKTTPDLKTRLFTGLTNLFIGESHFYNTIRPTLAIESPLAFYADYDLRSCRSILIMEDIAKTRGATFGAPQTLNIDQSRALDMTSVMASYHGAFWDSPRLDGEFPWLRTSPDWQRHLDAMINTESMVRRGIERAESALPDDLLRRKRQIWPAFVASLDLKSRRPITLLHHDVHSKNWYVTGDGRMGLYDWQTIVTGTWAIDFSYAINCGLAVDDRRLWLPLLLDNYLDRLAECGVVEPPTVGEAWQNYREQSIHGLIFWLATIGAGRLQPDLHDEKDCLINIERMAHAVVDAKTLDVLL